MAILLGIKSYDEFISKNDVRHLKSPMQFCFVKNLENSKPYDQFFGRGR